VHAYCDCCCDYYSKQIERDTITEQGDAFKRWVELAKQHIIQYISNKSTTNADKVGIALLTTSVTTIPSLADLQHDGMTTVIADVGTDVDSTF
jgi:hypothetical protein